MQVSFNAKALARAPPRSASYLSFSSYLLSFSHRHHLLTSPSLHTVAAGSNKAHAGVDHAHLAKLDRENEVAPPPKVSPDVGKAIAQARQAKGLTQKDLGTKVSR